MKKIILTFLALALAATAQAAVASKAYDLRLHASSATMRVGYPSVEQTPPAVLVASGTAVIQSTTATSGHKLLVVKNNAGTEVMSVTNGGVLTGATISGNASTASALLANGANCTAGQYPLGVDASGAAEGCTAAGIGDAVLSATQTFSGYNIVTSTLNAGPAVYTSTAITNHALRTVAAGVYNNVYMIVASTNPSGATKSQFTGLSSTDAWKSGYRIIGRLKKSGAGNILLRVNNDSGTVYKYGFRRFSDTAGVDGLSNVNGADGCQLNADVTITDVGYIFFELDVRNWNPTDSSNANRVDITGQVQFNPSSGGNVISGPFACRIQDTTTGSLSTLEISNSGGNNFTGYLHLLQLIRPSGL